MAHGGTTGEDVGATEIPATAAPTRATTRSDGLWLTLVDGLASGTLPLPPNGSFTIGRAPSCDIRLATPLASRKHAELHLGPRVEIEDLGSSNGTLLGGTRIASRVRVTVSPGDLIEIGDATLVVRGLNNSVSRASTSSSHARSEQAASGRVVVSAEMKAIYGLVQRIAPSELPVLILGETGVGKEVIAEAFHTMSPRRAGPFLRINCATLSESLLESELFGYERGAFTGAVKPKPGLLESANGGTVFLDEIGEMVASVQAKLLRVLEVREVLRIGGLEPRKVSVRFIAATNRDLREAIEKGLFREDLYYRLSGLSVRVPPLRERQEEVELLADLFCGSACSRLGIAPVLRLSPAAVEKIREHRWPGNIRELRNVIERAVLLCPGGSIEPEHLMLESEPPKAGEVGKGAAAPAQASGEPVPADDERERIVAALNASAGNQGRAAKLLGISRSTFIKRLERYDIPRPQQPSRSGGGTV